jgi:penicillin-binding protein 2
VVDITPRDRRRFKRCMEESRSFESLPIRTRLTDDEVARFAAQRYRFPGVEIKARLFRNYPYGRTRQPRDWLHRPHQPEREERIEDSDDEGQLPRHRLHRQAGRGAEL